MKNPRKAGIIGLGNVGASIAFAFMQKGLFSELVLVDYNHDKAEGEAMDLRDGLPYTKTANVYAGDYSELGDASLIVITAGAPRKPGESRVDLIAKNTSIMKSVIDNIKATGFEGILLIVSNPVDIMTHIAQKLSGYPEERVIGSGTVLDTARLKSEIARNFDVDQQNIATMIIGEHGDSQVPLWSRTYISGIEFTEFCEARGNCTDCKIKELLFEKVKVMGQQIIKKKGATYYGIAMAVTKIASSIVRDEKSVLSVSVEPNGKYGLSGMHLSLPCIIGAEGVEKVMEIKLKDEELAKLQQSGKFLKEFIDEIESGEEAAS